MILRPPRHGWLPYCLRLGTFELVGDALGVLNDPVLELANCVEALASGRPDRARICLWSEPSGYAVDVETAPNADVAVTVWSDEDFVPPMKRRPMLQEWSGMLPRAALEAEFRSVLSRWLENIDDTALKHWCHAPAEYREQLRRRLGE
jgi:hypothetical protein